MTELEDKTGQEKASGTLPCYVTDSDWISSDDCLNHSGDWQYWRKGKRHCLGCLKDAVEKNKKPPTLNIVSSIPVKHKYKPHKKYPWFCSECGYPEYMEAKHI
jgi:hypothetical protein